jgi:hypothetical protein
MAATLALFFSKSSRERVMIFGASKVDGTAKGKVGLEPVRPCCCGPRMPLLLGPDLDASFPATRTIFAKSYLHVPALVSLVDGRIIVIPASGVGTSLNELRSERRPSSGGQPGVVWRNEAS